jgi:hypothetical protein
MPSNGGTMLIRCYVCGEEFHAIPPILSIDDETCIECLKDEEDEM